MDEGANYNVSMMSTLNTNFLATHSHIHGHECTQISLYNCLIQEL